MLNVECTQGGSWGASNSNDWTRIGAMNPLRVSSPPPGERIKVGARFMGSLNPPTTGRALDLRRCFVLLASQRASVVASEGDDFAARVTVAFARDQGGCSCRQSRHPQKCPCGLAWCQRDFVMARHWKSKGNFWSGERQWVGDAVNPHKSFKEFQIRLTRFLWSHSSR
jgi:hypothetical protein